jgi:ribonucleoside-diphosphate reductase alpha chain
MMATLRCDHPDIEEFVDAKRTGKRLANFNLSVQISDAFMDAVRKGAEWALVFPADKLDGDGPTAELEVRSWVNGQSPVSCRVLKRVPAQQLWAKIMRSAYESAEPGVLFVDRINRLNNLWYCEHLTATNPCGEIPLPPYGACDLGSINLTAFVLNPFSAKACWDVEGIRSTTQIATRMLDNVIDVSHFPLDAQKQQAYGSRRIGLGLTGLADALIMLGLHYGDARARSAAASAMQTICHTAYRTSVALAAEKGSFPMLRAESYLKGEFVGSLPADIRQGIGASGIRNSHLTAIAPTGSISLLANNVSSGLEPVFGFRHSRRILDSQGNLRAFELTDYAARLWEELRGGAAPLPKCFVEAHGLEPTAHLEMQAALQPYVDNAISKTVNVPEDYSLERFEKLYDLAYEKGLKGCTTFRPNRVTGEVLAMPHQTSSTSSCCNIEREGD